jgi:hypothetical protein
MTASDARNPQIRKFTDLQKALKGASYPSRKEELLKAAKKRRRRRGNASTCRAFRPGVRQPRCRFRGSRYRGIAPTLSMPAVRSRERFALTSHCVCWLYAGCLLSSHHRDRTRTLLAGSPDGALDLRNPARPT